MVNDSNRGSDWPTVRGARDQTEVPGLVDPTEAIDIRGRSKQAWMFVVVAVSLIASASDAMDRRVAFMWDVIGLATRDLPACRPEDFLPVSNRRIPRAKVLLLSVSDCS